MDFLSRHTKRLLLEMTGWILIVAGVAALVLPGPGLLLLFAGLALLSTQYEWAERRLEPVKKAALKTAVDSVSTWPRILISVAFAFGIMVIGLVWGIHPGSPSWWPLADKWWLIGGWGTGSTLIASGLIALGMIVYSYIKFRKA